MNQWRIGFMIVSLLAVVTPAQAWTDMAVRGSEEELGSWGTGLSLSQANGIWRGSVSINPVNTVEFKYYTSNDGGKWYGYFMSYTILPPEALSFSGAPENGRFIATDGYYYTFTAIDSSSLSIALQQTAAQPVSISSFSSEVANGGHFDRQHFGDDASAIANSVNTVDITLGATPGSGEKVFLYYSTDNFASQANSDAIEASGSGTSWTANIPAQSGNLTVDYYVLTSTFGEADLDGVAAEMDVLLRGLAEGKSSQWDYSVDDTGNAFHIISQNAGTAGEPMRAGGNQDSGRMFDGSESTARIYSGNAFQNVTVSKDQSAYTLHYKFGNGSWQTQAGAWNNTAANDKYWLASITLTGQTSGTYVYYYLQADYTDADTTYIYDGADNDSTYITGNPATAQAHPYVFRYGDATGARFILR